MPDFAAPLDQLIQELKRLPGIGQKSAQRIAFHILRTSEENVRRLVEALAEVKTGLVLCAQCNNISDREVCHLCADEARDRTVICVVEEPHNILPVETTRQYHGLYHVLHGSISPLRGIGPEQLRLQNLLQRIGEGHAQEIILATNPTVEGEATAAYLARLLKPLGLRVSRIAMGIPVGSDLEFADEVTMTKSMENRREM
ncbi:MAG: recombination mediator RecR [Bryobacterales bacterium]|jgi:recombination protein RecR|nr:recombination mediator RecR [Bryobacterales bacterium]